MALLLLSVPLQGLGDALDLLVRQLAGIGLVHLLRRHQLIGLLHFIGASLPHVELMRLGFNLSLNLVQKLELLLFLLSHELHLSLQVDCFAPVLL